MFYYKVIHKYRSDDQDEMKEIGVSSSKEKAFQAIDEVKVKPGFADRQDGFSMAKIFRLFKPVLADRIFWRDGFDTYHFDRRSNEICCDEEKNLMKYFAFLLTEYGFRFDKLELGDLVDENEKRWFYGPYNCYYFYNDKVCVNFMNLVQRQDWNVYVTNAVLSDQDLIKKGKEVPGELCYDWSLLASTIKKELAESQTILGIKIN